MGSHWLNRLLTPAPNGSTLQRMAINPELQARIEALRSSGKAVVTSTDELSVLRQKLAAREGVAGYTSNVEALKARIQEMEALQGDDQ